jgi:futalosine hydrolase
MTLARLLPLAAAERPRLIANVGIAGAYAGAGLGLGDLAAAESEAFGDLGMETPGPEAFVPLAAFPWCDEVYRRPLPLTLEPWAGTPAPRAAHGCTVNACTGRAATGALRRAAFHGDFETMEGAAVALAGQELGIPAAELRAISNIAADRDMRPGNMALALGSLGAYMAAWLGRRP